MGAETNFAVDSRILQLRSGAASPKSLFRPERTEDQFMKDDDWDIMLEAVDAIFASPPKKPSFAKTYR